MAQQLSRKIAPGARTLPGKYYNDPEILSREIEGVFQSMWICAGRYDEILKPGDYITRQIGSENVVVVRDQKDRINAFYNNCRHRGTRMCHETAGSVKGSIQCPYHAWTYGLDGRLIGAPHMNEVEDFDKKEWSLHKVACDVWDGHVFINMAKDPAPLAEQLGRLPKMFARFGMGNMRRVARVNYDIAANWKLIVENYSECYHCPLIHPDLNRVTHYLSGKSEDIAEHYNGGYQIIGQEYCTLTVEGKQTRPHFKGIRKADQNRVYYYTVYPNFLLSLHPDYMMTHTLWPKSPNEVHVVCEWHVEAETLEKPGFTIQDAVEFWDMTNKQDWHACEISHLGISSKSYSPGPFSHQEVLIYEFDRFVLSRLEGKPSPLRKLASAR
jgi:Rieske 2Fe-2S family protein